MTNSGFLPVRLVHCGIGIFSILVFSLTFQGCSSSDKQETDLLSISSEVIVIDGAKILLTNFENRSDQNLAVLGGLSIIDSIWIQEPNSNEWKDFSDQYLSFMEVMVSQSFLPPPLPTTHDEFKDECELKASFWKKDFPEFSAYLESLCKKEPIVYDELYEQYSRAFLFLESSVFLKGRGATIDSIDITTFYKEHPGSRLRFSFFYPFGDFNDGNSFEFLKFFNCDWLKEEGLSLPDYFDGFKVVKGDFKISHEVIVELE